MDDANYFCDNRSAVLTARKGNEGMADMSRKARHVAIRFNKVLDISKVLVFCPTDEMLADGLTKTINEQALKNLFYC